MAQQRGRPRKNVNVENAQDVDFTEESIVGDEVMGEDFEPQVEEEQILMKHFKSIKESIEIQLSHQKN